jgi:integrase
LLQELKEKLKQQMFTPFKNLHLYDAKGDITKPWYVEYHFLIPGTFQYKRFKEKFEMNRLHKLGERRTYANECLQFLRQKLREGFNPFEQVKVVGSNVDFRIKIQLQKILNDLCRNASHSAAASYQEHYNRFCKFIDAKSHHELFIVQLNVDHAKSYKRFLLYELNLSVKTVNASLSYMAMYWEDAVDKKWSSSNPFIAVPRAKRSEKAISEVETEERFEPLTAAEMDQVFEVLKEKKEFAFIRFLAFIFYAWARPVEISRLKISDVDLNRNLIRFRKGQTKNNKAAYVQIVPPLRKILLQMKLHEYPADHYLFSGDGDGFLPGKTQLTKYRAGERWRRYVKGFARKGGTKSRRTVKGDGINKDMYALKHTGNIEYLLQNVGKVDLKWQQMQNRHSSSAMTDRYNRKLGIYLIDVGEVNFRHFEI